MTMMISASSWVAVLVIFISFWVDHVNSLHCSNHHLPAASSRVIQQQYPCSVRHRPTAIHLDMRVVMRHTRISRLSLVHPSFCTHSIDSSSSSNIRKEMALQAGAPDSSGGDKKGPRPKKVKDDVIEVTGKVIESLPNATFRVEIEPSKQVVFATISGKIRKNQVRIIVGDSVSVELSAYDLTRGRITYRNK